MKSIFLNMRSKYSEMGPGERKIADLLISDPSSILPLSITEFSKKPAAEMRPWYVFRSGWD